MACFWRILKPKIEVGGARARRRSTKAIGSAIAARDVLRRDAEGLQLRLRELDAAGT